MYQVRINLGNNYTIASDTMKRADVYAGLRYLQDVRQSRIML